MDKTIRTRDVPDDNAEVLRRASRRNWSVRRSTTIELLDEARGAQ